MCVYVYMYMYIYPPVTPFLFCLRVGVNPCAATHPPSLAPIVLYVDTRYLDI